MAAKAITPKGFELVAVNVYGDVGATVEYRKPDDKTFRQLRKVAAGYELGAPSCEWPLYGDTGSGGLVYVVEGEKCADTMRLLGLPCITSAGGSSAAAKTDWEPLAGCEVVILPDNDNPGEKYAKTVAEILGKLNPPARSRIAKLPNLPDGGDVADWVKAHDTKDPEELAARLQNLTANPNALPAVDAADYLETDPPKSDPIITGIFELGDKLEIIGGSKRRKSFYALELAIHVALGRDWIGLKIPKRRHVLILNLELKSVWVHRRTRRTCTALGVNPDELRGWLHIVNARSKGAFVRHNLPMIVARENTEFVIIDPRYKLMLPGENENAGDGIQGILDLCDTVAESGPAVAIVHHDPKGEAGDRAIADRGGGSNWAGRDVDARFALTPQKSEPDDVSVVSVMARNYAPVKSFCIRWDNGCFRRDDELAALPYTSNDRRKGLSGATGRNVQSFEADALKAGTASMSKDALIVAIREAGASRDVARACIERLVDDGRLVHTKRTGTKGGIVRYGTPEAIEKYQNPRLLP